MDATSEDEGLFSLPGTTAPEGDVRVDPTFATAERIHLDETSWVDHVHGWLSGDRALMRTLLRDLAWEQRSRWMYTRSVQEPRLTAEIPIVERAPVPELRAIADALSAYYERRFSRLWMNHYRDHRDSTGWHVDRPAHQQPEAVIPVLSLGASRRFLIRPLVGGSSRSIVCRGGDLVVMGGRAQRDHEHSVPKQSAPAGPRVSLNFSVATTG